MPALAQGTAAFALLHLRAGPRLRLHSRGVPTPRLRSQLSRNGACHLFVPPSRRRPSHASTHGEQGQGVPVPSQAVVSCRFTPPGCGLHKRRPYYVSIPGGGHACASTGNHVLLPCASGLLHPRRWSCPHFLPRRGGRLYSSWGHGHASTHTVDCWREPPVCFGHSHTSTP